LRWAARCCWAGDAAAALGVLEDAWSAPAVGVLPASSRLEVAGLLAWCLLETGDADRARRWCAPPRLTSPSWSPHWGTRLPARWRCCTPPRRDWTGSPGDVRSARRRSARAAELVAVQAHPAVAVLVLVDAAEAALHLGEVRAAVALLDHARESARDAPPVVAGR
jgi:LuxR family maltose regulon positive regulatory protein